LRYDFPRLPLTADIELFRALVIRGEQLVRFHVGEIEAPTATHFPIKGNNCVEQIRYAEPGRAGGSGRLWINANQYFSDVPTKVWQFRIGGYQICRKWLSDRKGGRLSAREQACYVRIVNVLSETVRLMHDIDGVIEQHGGWPIQGMRPVVTPPESTRRLAAKPHAAIKASVLRSPAQAVLDSCLSYT
jgi:Type ISP C-terminal specificity domain